jgi:hypothetical protein
VICVASLGHRSEAYIKAILHKKVDVSEGNWRMQTKTMKEEVRMGLGSAQGVGQGRIN